MKAIIHKTVDTGERDRCSCPFCGAAHFYVRPRPDGVYFYHCFMCQAGGCATTIEDHDASCPARHHLIVMKGGSALIADE